MMLLMGSFFYFMFNVLMPFPINDPLFNFFSYSMLGIGLILLPISVVGYRRDLVKIKEVRSVLVIAGVRKSVSISELRSHTGLEYERVVQILTEALLSGMIGGYIEGDEFIRDTSFTRVDPRIRSMGLGGVGSTGDMFDDDH
jgi:hypothetical protein